jgi:hypothetical protein
MNTTARIEVYYSRIRVLLDRGCSVSKRIADATGIPQWHAGRDAITEWAGDRPLRAGEDGDTVAAQMQAELRTLGVDATVVQCRRAAG